MFHILSVKYDVCKSWKFIIECSKRHTQNILMSEFYLVGQYGDHSVQFYSIGSTKRLLEFLQEEFGRGEETIVTKIEDEKWTRVEPYEEFVSFVEKKDLFPEICENNGITGVKKATDAFEKMRKNLGRLLPGTRDKGQLFACGECQVVFKDLKKCDEDECVCVHYCDCKTFQKVQHL